MSQQGPSRTFPVGAGARKRPRKIVNIIQGDVHIHNNFGNISHANSYNSHNQSSFSTSSSKNGHIYSLHAPNNDSPVDRQTSNPGTTPIVDGVIGGQESRQGHHGEQRDGLAPPTVHGNLSATQDAIQANATHGHVFSSPPPGKLHVGVQTDPWANDVSSASQSGIRDGSPTLSSPTFTKGYSSSPGFKAVGIQTGQAPNLVVDKP